MKKVWIALTVFILEIASGVSQSDFVMLTRNVASSTVCPGTEVEYVCFSNTFELRWSVETSNGSEIPSIPPYIQGFAMPGPPQKITDNIEIELLATQPFFVSTLKVTIERNSSYDNATVICRTEDSQQQSEFTMVDGEMASPPGKLDLSLVAAELNSGAIMVGFPPSEDEDVDRYVCSYGVTASEVVIDKRQRFAILEVGTSISGRCFDVTVHGVDKCGNESPRSSGSICVKTTPGYSTTIILLAVVGGIIVLVVPILVIVAKQLHAKKAVDGEHLRGEKIELK